MTSGQRRQTETKSKSKKRKKVGRRRKSKGKQFVEHTHNLHLGPYWQGKPRATHTQIHTQREREREREREKERLTQIDSFQSMLRYIHNKILEDFFSGFMEAHARMHTFGGQIGSTMVSGLYREKERKRLSERGSQPNLRHHIIRFFLGNKRSRPDGSVGCANYITVNVSPTLSLSLSLSLSLHLFIE